MNKFKEFRKLKIKLWQWEKGQQNSIYHKFCLWNFWRIDCYILRINDGFAVPPHKDTVDGHNHYRCNFILNTNYNGGKFTHENPILNWNRIKIFDSGSYFHSVTKVTNGCRYMMSFGLVI